MFELKVTGLVLATGEATFVDDMPTFSNELFMAPVLRFSLHYNLSFEATMNNDHIHHE